MVKMTCASPLPWESTEEVGSVAFPHEMETQCTFPNYHGQPSKIFGGPTRGDKQQSVQVAHR